MGPAPRRSGRNFYLAVALATALIVAIGFGPTANARLFRPSTARPLILYVHAATFTAWVLLFIAQAALVRAGRAHWHRRLGLLGIVLGGLLPLVGIMTAFTMTRLNRAESGADGEAFLIVSLFDMLAFAVIFGLAVYWRRHLEYHRRLMLMATCGLTVAAFARFPQWVVPSHSWYAFVDALILTGAARDWITTRRVHPVYLYGLPALALGQAATMWIYMSRAPIWIAIAHALLR